MQSTPYHTIRHSVNVVCKALCLITVSAAPSLAQNPTENPSGLQVEVRGSEVGTWDSNPLMVSKGAKSLTGSKTTPELIITNIKPTSSFSLDTSIDENLYDQSAYNSTDFHGKLGLGKKNERWDAELGGQADYDTTRTSELTTFNQNLKNVRHTGFSASPQLSYNVSQLDKIILNTSVSNSTYSNSAFTDYNYYSITPTYAHSFSQTDYVSFGIEANRYDAQAGPSNTVDSFGPLIGWQSLITPRFTSHLAVGFEKSKTSSAVPTSKPSNLNYVFKGNLGYKDEQDKATLSATRAQQPFGNGTETLLTTLGLNGSHAINELLSVNASVTYEFAQYGHVLGVNLDNQLSSSAGLTYNVLEELDLNANYKYTSESLTNLHGKINDNSVIFGLVYHPLLGNW